MVPVSPRAIGLTIQPVGATTGSTTVDNDGKLHIHRDWSTSPKPAATFTSGDDELDLVRQYEHANRGRKTILSKIAQLQL